MAFSTSFVFCLFLVFHSIFDTAAIITSHGKIKYGDSSPGGYSRGERLSSILENLGGSTNAHTQMLGEHMPSNDLDYNQYNTYSPSEAGDSYNEPYYPDTNDQYSPGDNDYQDSQAADYYGNNVYNDNTEGLVESNNNYQQGGNDPMNYQRQNSNPMPIDGVDNNSVIGLCNLEGPISVEVKKFMFQAQAVRPGNEKTTDKTLLYYVV